VIAHAPILPILIPFVAALLQLARENQRWQRGVGLLASVLLLSATLWLLWLADDGVLRVYALGGWPAPFGIVLVVDRLAAAMSVLVASLALPALLYATAGFDARGRHFQPLFQLQLMGLLGAFLTGDLFNLFVFFEVMLLASYALLAHAGGLARTRAGIAYVVLNLLGSSVFLIALGLLYGALGTLNLADLAQRLALDGHDRALARLACALLIAVFALKAGLLPLSFWLPAAYGAAGAPVAALFAVMTKVGIVAILRLQAVALAPAMPDLLAGWLTTLALATVAFAALGVLAATRLRALAAWLILLSAGTLLLTPAPASEAASAAAIYYSLHSTLAGAALFLIAGVVGTAEDAEDTEDAGEPCRRADAPVDGLVRARWIGPAFLIVAATLAGLPPFSGFIAKLMLLSALRETPAGAAIWLGILAAGFLTMIVLTREGCRLFLKNRAPAERPPAPIAWQKTTATVLLAAAGPLLALLAPPLSAYAERAARQLHAPGAYVAGVLGAPTPGTRPENRQ
jgi:multicomponent K+:H+ antiporter subunit D